MKGHMVLLTIISSDIQVNKREGVIIMIDIKEFIDILKDSEIYCVETIEKDTKVFEELNIDSLSIMQVICCFEEKYKVHFSEEQIDFEETLTVGELLDLFNSNLKG